MSTQTTLNNILKRLILPLLVAALALGALPAAGNSTGSGAKHEGKEKSGKSGHKSDKHDDDDKSGKRRDDDDDDKSGKHRDDDDDDKPGDDDKPDKPGDDDDKPGDDDGPGQSTPPSTPGPASAPATPTAPGTAGQPAQPATQPPTLVVRGTSRRKCASVRSFRIRLREGSSQRLRWARVKVNGRTVKVVRGDRLRATVSLKGLPKGRFYVRIVAMTTSGKRVSAVRAYRTCTKKQARKYKGKV